MSADPLLEVQHLAKAYPLRPAGWGRGGESLRAVDDVSFTIYPGETLGLVGESGCGKSTTGRAILRLIEPTAGTVLFHLRDGKKRQTHSLLTVAPSRLRRLRRHLQMVFLDSYGSFSPRLPVGTSLEEGLRAHGMGNRAERRQRIDQLLDRVGLERGAVRKYPHEFSGGQRQRLGIARALAVEPMFVVCDEPVSALDVSVQAQIVNLLMDLQRERGLAYLFISHDLAVIAHVSHCVAVMFRGQIVEIGPGAALFREPAHPYTRSLLACVPGAESTGTPVPNPGTAPSNGCRFYDRCPDRRDECAREEPPLVQLNTNRQVRCHLWRLADS